MLLMYVAIYSVDMLDRYVEMQPTDVDMQHLYWHEKSHVDIQENYVNLCQLATYKCWNSSYLC